jgi:hypothetical protein
MRKKPLQALNALQRVVAFAEGETSIYPVVVLQSGDGIVAPSSTSLPRVQTLTADEIVRLQIELRSFLRSVPTGDAHMIAPIQMSFSVVIHAPATPPKGRRATHPEPRAASMLQDGSPRDLLFGFTRDLLLQVAVETLQLCPGCGKAFVKMTKKRFCSPRCQMRIYKRDQRAAERAEREAFTQKKGVRYGKTTRTR